MQWSTEVDHDERAHVVAHYRLTRLVDQHVGDAVRRDARRREHIDSARREAARRAR